MDDFESRDSLKKWYSGGYRVCYYSGVIGKAYGLVHQLMEIKFNKNDSFKRVLEVGSGNGEHLTFVRHDFQQYYMTDLEPIVLNANVDDARIILGTLDCTDLSEFEDKYFDRVIATCLLVHLKEPEIALSEWKRVTKEGGDLTIYIATEPGILLTLVRTLFIWPKARRLGISNPAFFAYSQHINHYPRMNSLIKETFKGDKISRRRYPFPFLSWHLSLFEILHIKISPDIN
jgi:ubiquinone/menaquinone biosynthesis C-methylase UbiE